MIKELKAIYTVYFSCIVHHVILATIFHTVINTTPLCVYSTQYSYCMLPIQLVYIE